MVDLCNSSDYKSLGESLWLLLLNFGDLSDVEMVINSNSNKTQTIYLDSIKKICFFNDSALFYGISGINDFLNLNNVLSISLVGV